MNILFISPIFEYPAAGGPALRIENSIKALRQIGNLHIVCGIGKRQMGGQAAIQFYESLASHFSLMPTVKNILPEFLEQKFPSVARRFNRFAHELFVGSDAKYVSNYCKTYQIDVIWFGFGCISFPLIQKIQMIAPQMPTICDTDSVWSRFILRELDSLADDTRRKEILQRGKEKEKEEKQWVNSVSITTAVSDVDLAYYQSHADKPHSVMRFSNVIDTKYYEQQVAEPPNFKKPAILFAGTFWRNSPMEAASRWLITDIMPFVLEEVPDVHLYLVGKGSDTTMSDATRDWITVTGKVESVLPYLQHTHVSVVPLLFESGTRFKILEAGACSIPVVSTTLGAEGLDTRSGKHILIADDAQQFARAMVRVLKEEDLAKNLAENLNKRVHDSYAIDNLVKEGRAILQRIEDNQLARLS